MSKLPSMPLFIDAFLADTTHLTTEERGGYLLLLMSMWRHNAYVPDSDNDNARITGLSMCKWLKLKERLKPLLIFEEGMITQKRLKKEWFYCVNRSESQRQKGIKSGEARRNKNKELDRTRANGGLKPETNPSRTPNPIPIDSTLPKEGRGEVADLSKWIFDEGKNLLCVEAEDPMTRKAAGGVIKKWLKVHGEQVVADAIESCRLKKGTTPYPMEYIAGTLRSEAEKDDYYFGQRMEEM